VSGYVVLCLSLPGAVVTYLVTGSGTILSSKCTIVGPGELRARYDHVARPVIPVRRSCSVRPGSAAATDDFRDVGSWRRSWDRRLVSA
jgi:hypothetical protein